MRELTLREIEDVSGGELLDFPQFANYTLDTNLGYSDFNSDLSGEFASNMDFTYQPLSTYTPPPVTTDPEIVVTAGLNHSEIQMLNDVTSGMSLALGTVVGQFIGGNSKVVQAVATAAANKGVSASDTIQDELFTIAEHAYKAARADWNPNYMGKGPIP